MNVKKKCLLIFSIISCFICSAMDWHDSARVPLLKEKGVPDYRTQFDSAESLWLAKAQHTLEPILQDNLLHDHKKDIDDVRWVEKKIKLMRCMILTLGKYSIRRGPDQYEHPLVQEKIKQVIQEISPAIKEIAQRYLLEGSFWSTRVHAHTLELVRALPPDETQFLKTIMQELQDRQNKKNTEHKRIQCALLYDEILYREKKMQCFGTLYFFAPMSFNEKLAQLSTDLFWNYVGKHQLYPLENSEQLSNLRKSMNLDDINESARIIERSAQNYYVIN